MTAAIEAHPRGAQFLDVTERGGEPVSRAQVDRFFQRYLWAGEFAAGKDVLEMACGTGPGLGQLRSRARSLVAGDLDADVLALARAHYGDRIDLRCFDATATPFADASFDAIVLFEAIYYIPDVEALAREVHRLLRPGGVFLLATANKDLPDFNPSPFSCRYLNPPELRDLFARQGMASRFFGGSPVAADSLKGRVLRWLKKAAVRWKLIPGSMKGKRLLKRLVFGKLVTMPRELDVSAAVYVPPQPIPADQPDLRHLVLYCAATKA